MPQYPHPGALQFTEEARRAVALGPLFNHRKHKCYLRYDDGRCVVGALLVADYAEMIEGYASSCRTPSTGDVCDVRGEAGDPTDRDAIAGLIRMNDSGAFCDRAELVAALLGREALDGLVLPG